MSTIIIAAVIVLIAAYGGYSYVKKLRVGDGCCGTRDAAEKKVKVADKDKSHYPYEVTLKIDGMTCGNCQRRVENALNRMDGVWATVDLEHGTALVRMKEQVADETFKQTVRDIGYTVYGFVRDENQK